MLYRRLRAENQTEPTSSRGWILIALARFGLTVPNLETRLRTHRLVLERVLQGIP